MPRNADTIAEEVLVAFHDVKDKRPGKSKRLQLFFAAWVQEQRDDELVKDGKSVEGESFKRHSDAETCANAVIVELANPAGGRKGIKSRVEAVLATWCTTHVAAAKAAAQGK